MKGNKMRPAPGGEHWGFVCASAWRAVLGAALLAAALFALVAMPGFVSDLDSTVPMHAQQEARQ